MNLIALCGAVLLQPPSSTPGDASVAESVPAVVVVQGARGTKEYGEQFATWAGRWKSAANQGQAEFISIGLIGSEAADEQSDKKRLQGQLQRLVTNEATTPIWLVLIGHGTYDGRAARFNLQGPDVSATELSGWLEASRRPVAIINCSSSSGPFLRKLAAPNRVVITATKSGAENNFARFGDHMSAAIGDISADVDQDGQTSLLEAWITAARKTQEFYDTEGRLATEHSLLDDSGDGLGVRAEWFQGVRIVGKAAEKTPGTLDGRRAHQWHLVATEAERSLSPELKQKRDSLELAVFKLRDEKPTLPETQYYQRLEALLVELAELYEK